MTDLHAITYVSSVVHVPSAAEIQHLLSRARERNAELGLTGLLLYGEGSFMQYIEGAHDPLMQVYEIILNDPLHHHIIELINEPVATREFADWAMGYSTETMPRFLKAAAPGQVELGPARKLLRAVWRKSRQRG